MPKDLATVVQNWTTGAGGAQAKYVQGIETTDVDPTQRAVASVQALLTNFMEAVQSGRWQRNLAAVGKAGWQAAAVAKAANYGTGIAAGRAAYEGAMQTWLPVINAEAARVRAMPSGTLSQNLARANTFATALYNRKRGL